MKIVIKLQSATYTAYLEGISLTLDCASMGKDKDGNPKEIITNIGFYGPGQVDIAIDRIIKEELTRNQDVVNLREFLIRSKAIHESIGQQVAELKELIKENRLKIN